MTLEHKTDDTDEPLYDGVVTAVILAAGFGTRLGKVGAGSAKALLDVGGQPVLTRILRRVAKLRGLGRVVVVVNEKFHADFDAWAGTPGNTSFLECPLALVSNGVSNAKERPGAVADMMLGMEAAGAGGSDHWLILAGDNLLHHDLQPYLNAVPDEENAVLCRDLGDDVPPGRFGEVTVDDDSVVVGFREKPDDPKSPLAATCTYILDYVALPEAKRYLSEGGDADAPGSFVGWLSGRRTVHALPLRGAYFDIGNLETLEEARAAFAKR